jgi:hypothetical protein
VWVSTRPAPGSGAKPSKLRVLAMKAERNAAVALGCLCSGGAPDDGFAPWRIEERVEVLPARLVRGEGHDVSD